MSKQRYIYISIYIALNPNMSETLWYSGLLLEDIFSLWTSPTLIIFWNKNPVVQILQLLFV